jgi:hypothetical protein
MMQSAPCESAHERSRAALAVTKATEADEIFGASGIVIEPCFIVDPTPPIRPEAAQLTPPAAPMLVCSRRKETMTPASLGKRSI